MRRGRLLLVTGVAAVVAAACPTDAAGAALKVGDAAPKLQTGKWVQGEPVNKFETGKAYIVEFWATWCGPCRVSIPHLNELHNKYKEKGLVVIGQNSWENDDSQVEPFVKKMGDKMTYRVALDDKTASEKGKMAETWMDAAGQRGIPAAFLVNKEAKIAWIGHPMQLKEELLEQVLEGKHDLAKAAAEYQERAKTEEKLAGLSRELKQAMLEEDWETAATTLGDIERALPVEQRVNVAPARFGLQLAKRDYKAAAKLADEISLANKDNAMLQNELAWTLLTHEGIKEPDAETAERIATRANEAAQGKQPGILDTLARALFMQGKHEKAIELQQKAVDQADSSEKEVLRRTLDDYRQGKLPPAQ